MRRRPGLARRWRLGGGASASGKRRRSDLRVEAQRPAEAAAVAAAAARRGLPAASVRGSLDPLPVLVAAAPFVAVIDFPDSPAPVGLAVAAAAHASLYFHTQWSV